VCVQREGYSERQTDTYIERERDRYIQRRSKSERARAEE